MILRFTKKLADKLKITPKECELEVNPFEEWYAHLFIANRVQYIIFTNAYTLYSVIIPGKGILKIRDFIDAAFSSLEEMLKSDGLEMFMEYITLRTEIVDVCKTNNRGILGSMNDMIFTAKVFITESELSLTEITKRINDTPLSYINYECPLSALKQLII